jgi:hypothetical protein
MQNLAEIQNQLSRYELFDAFKKQLKKEFEQNDFPANFVDNLEPEYDSILSILAHELQRNEKKTDSTLLQLLYRIDISEAQVKKYWHANKHENYFLVLAEVIIKRVLQKVVVRHYYRNTNL